MITVKGSIGLNNFSKWDKANFRAKYTFTISNHETYSHKEYMKATLSQTPFDINRTFNDYLKLNNESSV